MCPDDITHDRMKTEKGVGFVPGGEIPSRVRATAWDFMGQSIRKNYGMLVFAQPLSTPDAFDPSSESIHGLLSGSSQQREEPSHDDDDDDDDDKPMRDPYTQPRGSSHQREAPQGSSPQGGAPQQDTSAEGWWEDHRSSSYLQKQMQQTTLTNHTLRRKMKSWKLQRQSGAGENPNDDEEIIHVTSSASSTNPGFCTRLGLFAQDKLMEVLHEILQGNE